MRVLPTSFYTDQVGHPPLKVNLFTQVHELDGLVEQLEKISQLSSSRKKSWLDEHEEFVQSMLEKLTQQAPLEFENLDVDNETLILLSEYTSKMQEVTNLVKHLFATREKA